MQAYYKEVHMDFKDKVLNLRAKLNLSQKALGEMLHVSLGTINRWESGKVQPTKKALCAFNQLCNNKNIKLEEELQND